MFFKRDHARVEIDARIDASEITFTVDSMEEIDPGCDQGASFWRRARR